MHVAAPELFVSGESSANYIRCLLPLFRRGRHLCDGLPRHGLPAFISLDDPSRFESAVLTAMAVAWPSEMLPNVEQRTWSAKRLQREGTFADTVIISTDPQHRVWRMQQRASSIHPDFAPLIEDVGLALNRMSAEPPVDVED